MAEDDQQKPLTPASNFHHSSITVDEALSTELRKQRHGFHKYTICCGVITAVILIISVVMLILGFTVLHVKNPKIKLNSVSIVGFDRLNLTELISGNANLTVVTDVSVKNTNVAAFKFEKSNSSLWYHGTVVGAADVPGGVAKARRTMRMNVTYEVAAAEIAGKVEFRSDLTAGILPVESYTKINGRIKILNIIKRKVTVSMKCVISIAVNVTSPVIINQNCKRHVYI